MRQRLAIFASGTGTNAENLIQYFDQHPKAEIISVYSNKGQAGVCEKAHNAGILLHLFNRSEFLSGEVLQKLREEKIDWVILAGFLWLMPKEYVEAFKRKIINIHPALLPAYGGKGMYGKHVHEAVLRNAENISGISIHYCNSVYDDGDIIAQYRCPVLSDDTIESLSERIHKLEMEWFPKVIEQLL